MRHFILLLLVLLCVAAPTDAEEPLSFVVPEYPPHFFADPASLHGASGLSVSIVSAALDKMEVSCTIKVYPWARNLYLTEQALMDGKADVVLSDSEVDRNLAKITGRERALVVLSPMVERVPSYVGFSKLRKMQSVRDRLDGVLRTMRQNGEIALLCGSITGGIVSLKNRSCA